MNLFEKIKSLFDNKLEQPQVVPEPVKPKQKYLAIKIKDIQMNFKHKIALVAVEVDYCGNKWNKPFELNMQQEVSLEKFRSTVRKTVVEELKLRDNIKEITDKQNEDILLLNEEMQ